MATALDTPAGNQTLAMTTRTHVREIEEALGQLAQEPDCNSQLALLFNVGRKFDSFKRFVQEMKAESEAGRLTLGEFQSLDLEFRQVREWASKSVSPLFDPFFGQYRFQVANSRKLMDKVFQLRHEVYCRELGFEPLKTDNKEVDDYDHLSRHVLLTRVEDPEHGIGCIRVVFLSPSTVDGLSTDQLPLMKLCKTFYSHNPTHLDRGEVCEISRLSLLAEYRTQRSTDPLVRLLTLALPLAAYVVGIHQNVKYAYQLCEPWLATYLTKSLGSPLTPIGEPVEHRGTRVPTLVFPVASVEGMDLIPYTFFRLLDQRMYPPTTSTTIPLASNTLVRAKL